jgi:hypothetical protein
MIMIPVLLRRQGFTCHYVNSHEVHEKITSSWGMAMVIYGSLSSFGISSEVFTRALMGLGMRNIIDFDWCELKCQTDGTETSFLANQYSLME